MPHPLDSLIDQIVSGAAAKGELDDLPGQGKPLPHLDNPADPLMARMMSEAKAKPLIVTLKEQIAASQARLSGLTDPDARKAEMKVMSDLQTRLAIEMESIARYG